jgi:hypothetical protein
VNNVGELLLVAPAHVVEHLVEGQGHQVLVGHRDGLRYVCWRRAVLLEWQLVHSNQTFAGSSARDQSFCGSISWSTFEPGS